MADCEGKMDAGKLMKGRASEKKKRRVEPRNVGEDGTRRGRKEWEAANGEEEEMGDTGT